MMNKNSIETIRKAVKIKYDEHVGKLLSIPDVYLTEIVPNRGLPLNGDHMGPHGDRLTIRISPKGRTTWGQADYTYIAKKHKPI
jgi:hypothetical protein